MSMTVSVAMKKYDSLSTNHIGRDKWKLTICSSVGLLLGRSKAIKGLYSIRNHIRMYASAGSTFPKLYQPES